MVLPEQTKKISNFSKTPSGSKTFQQNPNRMSAMGNSQKLKVGDICILKISALGPKGIGIDEYSYPYSIFVPNSSLGDTIKAKMIALNLKENKYGVAQILDIVKKSNSTASKVAPSGASLKDLAVPVKSEMQGAFQPDQILTVNIKSINSKGTAIVDFPSSTKSEQQGKSQENYKLIIPNAQVGNDIQICITRIKSNYGFAKILKTDAILFGDKRSEKNEARIKKTAKTTLNLLEGSKYTLILPKAPNYYGTYAIVKLENNVVFIKLALGANPGQKIRIKISKVNVKFAVANLILINPKSQLKKKIIIQNNIREMIKNGMHLGEKAVKCNARMKNYVWLKKQGVASQKNRKNSPLLKKDRHIINLLKTRRCLNKALTQLSKYALKGKTFLFIGTKKPASGLIARAALFSKTSFFVNTRWLGGMLTNWKTILKSISKIRPILKEKQKIIADILEKRQAIKIRLIKKALLLKKKSRLILNKGRFLIDQFKNESLRNKILTITKNFSQKRTELLENCYSLLAKRKGLVIKRRDLMYQSLVLKEKGIQMTSKYKNLLTQLLIYSKKLRELKYLLTLSNEIKNIKLDGKEKNKEIIQISYGKIKELTNSSNEVNFIPNPPKDILNLILTTMKNKYDNETTNSTIKSATPNSNVLIFSKLVSKFSRFSPYLGELIKKYETNISKIQGSLNYLTTNLNTIKATLISYNQLKTILVQELNGLKTKLISERSIIRLVKAKLKQFVAQKKLIKFLPRLRYLATPFFTNKITQTVKILMKKIVDPKLKYPVDNIYEDKLNTSSKKILAERKKKWQRLEKYFGGVANMTKMSKSQISKNVAILIGQREEMNAVRECQKLGIKMFNIVDTNCNPSFADHIIPANDDSRNSIKYVLNKFLVRIRLAQKLRKKLNQKLLKKDIQIASKKFVGRASLNLKGTPRKK